MQVVLRNGYKEISSRIIIIFFDPGTRFPGNEKIRYAIQKSTIIKLK